MSWTVACFCGNLYTAPPDQCDVCHSSLDHAATQATGGATETHSLAAAVVTDTNLRPQQGHSCWARPSSPPVVRTGTKDNKTAEKSQVADQAGRDARDRPAFSVRAMVCESAQLMLGEVYVQGGVRRTFCAPSFPFRISRVGVAAFIYIHHARNDEEHALRIWMRDSSDERDLPLGLRRADRSDRTDASPQSIHRVEYRFHTRHAFEPRTNAEAMRLPFCANFANLEVDSPGTYYFGLAIDEIELCRAPFLVAHQHSANGQTARAH